MFEPKTEFVMVRVTPTLAETLRACADREGVKLAAWVREAAVRRLIEVRAGQ
jgi:hypothetical protein